MTEPATSTGASVAEPGLAVYPSTRRATNKINAFIEHLREYLQRHPLS
ncbi:hypothetical protein NJF44_16440 [Pseudomonas guariconensis]|nr:MULTISPECIES: hypothetical protein [Pseudomonas]MCO7641643.1 hypothetical protein [Pseudomonas sp. S 311-6]MCO7516509.1 hypothetical protein [Pseudomonas putida]MCO7566763.1 hypothetical protein [Pseudomonas mosselii]MCO7606823.1 hypothetical protein [Pseudomonas guariconensis]MCO7617987.1 hypothetical protein [Pseudomonas guariconensis]